MRFRLRRLFVLTSYGLLWLLIAEGLLRVVGIKPFQLKPTVIDSQPAPNFSPHPELGIALNPGNFEVTINKGLQYTCTHGPDSTRITGLEKAESPTPGPKAFLFGCSFTYGMGVDDAATFPFLIQERLPGWKICNYGVPAYGTVQSLLQLRDQLNRGNIPQLVILNYASLHDSRNKLSLAQQKYWREVFTTGQHQYLQARFPYVPKISDGELTIQYLKIPEMQKRWAWSCFASLPYALEMVFDNVYDGFQPKHLISQKIILEFSSLCNAWNVPLIVTGIGNDKATRQMLDFCQANQIKTILLDIDLDDPKYTLNPYDSHPNELAHLICADKLLTYLTQSHLL